MGTTSRWTRHLVGWSAALAIGWGPGALRAQDPPTTQPVAPTGQAADLTSLSLEDLMNIEVTSVSKHKQKLAEAPAAVTVITQDDIQRSALQSIPELLRLAPGLDVARVDSSQWAISSRGFNDLFGNKLLVMMDGRTLYTPLFSGVFWDMQDHILKDLDRIEVIRGPGATLWGSNAVNGVINIETKSARDTQGWLIDAGGGNEQDYGSIRYGGKLDNSTYFRVFTKYRYFDDFPLARAGDGHDLWQSLLGGLRVDQFATDRDQLTIEASGYGSRNEQLLRVPFLAPPLERNLGSTFNAAEGYALGRWTHTISETSDMALEVYYDHLNRAVWMNAPYSLNTADIDFHHRFALTQRQEITWGLGYRFTADSVRPTELSPGTPSFTISRHRDDYFASGFIQDDIALVPSRLHFIAGTKLEENSYSWFEVQPSGKLLWSPNDTQTVWGSIARAVRTPSRWEQDSTLSALAAPTGTPLTGLVQAQPDPHFVSEELVAYELGYRVRPSRRLSLDLSGFFNHYDNLQGFAGGIPIPDPGPPVHLIVPERVSNDLYGHSFGGELAANWNVTDAWRLSASYSLIELKIHHSQPDPLGQSIYDERASPHNQFQVHSYWDVLKNLQFNASAYYVDSLGVGVPSYVRVDLGVVWRPRDGLELSAGVQNLLDNKHGEFGGLRVVNVDSQVPRTFYGQLAWRF